MQKLKADFQQQQNYKEKWNEKIRMKQEWVKFKICTCCCILTKFLNFTFNIFHTVNISFIHPWKIPNEPKYPNHKIYLVPVPFIRHPLEIFKNFAFLYGIFYLRFFSFFRHSIFSPIFLLLPLTPISLWLWNRERRKTASFISKIKKHSYLK